MSADELTGTNHPEAVLPRTPSQARTRVEALLREWLPPAGGAPDGTHAVGDAVLVTSELVTNALRHGGGLTSFDVEMTDQGCRVSVGDRSDRLPELASSRDGSGRLRVGGHGWRVIRRLARSITITPEAHGGKRVSVLISLA
ncbi:ATP-binding protein [Streptomyces sp. HNM0645]|uniref:ATP-binding protein n=1 Tax=Streptomyces sp. HNM0645 TaxID=2782343 RepID=UPI0024B8713D|nr:ATP-binding protein [Streptomyces sp. HNM0645]MDI9884470.1 ATP-binding protein [Streptomyces sp. HNM0645]